MKFIPFLALLMSAPLYALDADTDSATIFFDNYVALQTEYDTAVADLYADDAVIKALRRYPDQVEDRQIEFSGEKWKALIAAAMPLAKLRGDKSRYSEIEVTLDGVRARIKADRYAKIKCYLDEGYYMLIERAENGEYQIVEEYSETQAHSSCQP